MPDQMRTTAPQKTKLLPLEMEVPLRQWREELEYLERELCFYEHLLRLGLDVAFVPVSRELAPLAEQLRLLKHSRLPEMQQLIDRSETEAGRPNEIARSFLQKQEAFRQSFRRIKTRIFPVIDELRPMTIW